MTSLVQKQLSAAAEPNGTSKLRALAGAVVAWRWWLLAVVLYAFAMRHLEGIDPARPRHMWIALHSLISGASAFLLAGLGLTRRRELPERVLIAVLWLVTLAFFWLATQKFVISHAKHFQWVTLMHHLIQAAAIATAFALPAYWFGKPRLAVVALVIAAGALLVARGLTLGASPSPRIDVFTLAKEASAALWRGENPYAADYSNLYAGTPLDLGYSPGYNYFPAMLFINALSDKLVGDVRAGFVVCEVVCAFFIARFTRAFGWSLMAACLVSVLWCSNSLSFQVIEKWNDPLPLAGTLATLALLAERRWIWAGIVFGITAVTKQYLPLAALPIVLWLWRVGEGGQFWKPFVVGALVSGGLLSLPFLINQPEWLLARTMLHFSRTPFREESLSLLNWFRIVGHFDVHSWFIRFVPYIGIAAGLGIASRIVLRCQPLSAGQSFANDVHRLLVALLFAWAAFFHFIKQSFLNYHYFYFSLCVLLLVSMVVRSNGGPSPTRLRE